MSRTASDSERAVISAAIVRLQAGILALVCGLLTATGLFVATVWLVIRGGANVGQHLGLLSNYLPGYSVSWGGAVLGFLYGLIVGGAVGGLFGWTYNRLVTLRSRRATG